MKTLGQFLEEARKKSDKTTSPLTQIPQQYNSSDQGAATPVYEDMADQLDEINTKTLGSYIKAAGPDREKKMNDAKLISNLGHDIKSVDPTKAKEYFHRAGGLAAKAANRKTGINKAVDLLTNKRVYGEKDLNEKHLTPAEKKKREEVAQAIERENPGIDMSKKMAIATSTAKKVAEEIEDGVRKQKIMHGGEHVATIHTFRGRAGGWMSGAHNPDGSDASKKYGVDVNDTKKEILSKIKYYHKENN